MVNVIEDGKVKSKKDSNLSADDFKKIAEFICDTYKTRKNKRADRERLWKEVDRQIALQPMVPYKKGAGGKPIDSKRWMPELELPNQAQALEILTADALRMTFPDTGPWFAVHADIQSVQQQDSEVDISVLLTDSINQIVESTQLHFLRMFDYRAVWNAIYGEGFKYGNGVGRPKYVETFQGTFPCLAPVSIKNTYLDDNETALLAHGVKLKPGTIFEKRMKLADLVIAAKKGSRNIEDANGGWMPDMIGNLEADKKGLVQLLEFEGDLIVPISGSRTEVIENAVATAVIGKKGSKAEHTLVRLRIMKNDNEGVLNIPYHIEDINSPYGTSPLMKGCPIQKAASEALNRTMGAAILNTEPPINIPRDDAFYGTDDFNVQPGAKWKASKKVETVEIGDPTSLFAVYSNLNSQYADVTGIHAPRMGQETKSHTTAFAKDQEIDRGQARTVDFVRSTAHGPLTQWIRTHYEMCRNIVEEERIWLTRRAEFITISKDTLPSKVHHEVFGSAGPQESLARAQMKREALMTAIQVNQLGVQNGTSQPLNMRAIEKYLIQEAGMNESDVFTGNGQVSQGTQEAAGNGAIPEGAGGAGNVALQALAFGGDS